MNATLTKKIKDAIADHVAKREDTHGFSRLDLLLGEVAAKGPAYHPQLEAILLELLPSLKNRGQRTWESFRMIVEAASMRSVPVANCIMGILDKLDEPRDPAARYQAFLAFEAAGGSLMRPRLDIEKALREELTPQWVDLVLSALHGAPDNIISFIEEQLRDKRGKFTWEDVRRRFSLLFRELGPEFNRGIVRITDAVPDEEQQKKLAAAVKVAFEVDPLPELKPHKELVSTRTGRREHIRNRLFETTFGRIVRGGFEVLNAQSKGRTA